MDSSIFKKAGELLSRKSKYRHWQAVVAVLGVAVMGTTAIILSHPAQTMTKETYCGMEEHVHTAECYQPVLICGLEEEGLVEVDEKVAPGGTGTPVESLQPTPEATQTPEREPHQHDDSCYEEYLVLDCEETEAPIHQLGCYAGAEMLICGQEESADHIHTDECYDVVPVKALAYGQEESDTHTHSEDGEDSCYIVVGTKKLICGMEESEEHTHTEECYELIPAENFQCMEGHTHTESCYPQETEPALICGLEEQEAHTHTDECYTVTQKEELTCGQEESEEHEHTADCYETVEVKELTCGKEETEGHTHTEQCYSQDEEKTPICGREEKEVPPADAHVHTIACCRTEKKLICGKEEYIPEESTEPASEETTESTATPEATTEPEATPEVSAQPEATAEASAEPEATPEGSTQPQATAEATTEPENSPEASVQPTATAEASAQPEAVQVSGAPQESTAPESTVSPAPGEEGKHVHTDACYEMRLVCGLEEHTHTDECYKEAYCGIPAHVHMPGCYDEEGNVICGKEEHIHEGNCYKEPHCGITAHTHTEECYDENGELICGMEEHTHWDECFVEEDTYTGPFHCQEKIHQHTADCYDEENNLICGIADYVIHTHTEACYDEDGQLICPLPEIEEHAHSAQCYDIPGEGEEAQLNCGKEEAKLHTHTEECYDEEGNLTCGMLQTEEHVHSEACLKETEKAHIHTANCYDGMGNLICGYKEAHVHTEECYDEEGKLICGFEEEAEELPYYCAEYVHKHSEECYDENQNLICGKADFVAHVHTEDCYNKAGELVCPLPEIEAHTHTAACYSEANGQLEAELICGKTEDIKLHTHTEECYDADGKLICGKLEVLEHVHSDVCHVKPEAVEEITYYCQEMVHEHSEDCYNENGELNCGEADYAVHTHTEKCYGADGKLICPLPEVEVHTHTEECYDENGQLICGKEEAQLHTHTEECYDENGQLICGQLEVVEHIHSKDCEVSHKPVTKTFQGENFVVTATYKPEANIPEEAELIAERITAESNEEHYAKRQAEYQEALGDDKATMRALLKIGFYVDGEEVEPESLVTVTVQFLDENGLAEGKPITVIHFADEGTELLEGSKVEDGSTTFEMNSFSEIAVGYGVENVKVPVNEELKYETDEFQVTFKIEGEVRVPVGETESQEEQGAEGEDAVPGDSTEGEAAQGEENTVDNPEGGTQTGEGGVSVSIENSNLEKKLEFRVDPVSENAEEYAKAVSAVYADGTVKTENETTTGDGTQQEDGTNVADGILTEDGSQPEEGTDAGEDIEAAEPEIDMGGDQLFLQVLAYGILYDGQKLDLSDCTVTAEVRPSEALVEYAETALDPMRLGLNENETVAEDFEVKPEVVISAVVPKEDAEEGTLLDAMVVGSEPMMTFTLSNDDNDGVVALTGTSQANPNFIVQYYANLNVIDMGKEEKSGFPSLTVIDTSSAPGEDGKRHPNGSGGRLPGNGGAEYGYNSFISIWGTTTNTLKRPSNAEVTKIYLEANGNDKYKVKSQSVLKKVYKDNECDYITSPNLTYFNRLEENGHYKLVEVWVGSKAIIESTNREDWRIYTDISNVHFTNKQKTVEDNPEYILITEDTVIRLVCETTSLDETNKAQFYDYDITDGKIYDANGNEIMTRNGEYTDSNHPWYIKTKDDKNSGYGINRNGNLLGFGNDNAFTPLGKKIWNGNYLNRGNATDVVNKVRTEYGYGNCTFGLTSCLKQDGTIEYTSGVNPPKMFNDGSALGKENYDGTLTFERVGDTYTLKAANVNRKDKKTTPPLQELNLFNHPGNYDHIWTNNFWPMDNVDSAGTAGHDPKWAAKEELRANGKADNYMPPTDDSQYRNSYFGMYYTVDFKLTEDYVGPLEYLFYGDDDMWVFLSKTDGKDIIADKDGSYGKLICDIGGVHSSVGEYVDLWDWIKQGDSGNYRLSFFYTERGASGSSCWMQFTLPSVSFSTPGQKTAQVRIEKEVTGGETGELEFGFTIRFDDNSGKSLKDDYSYAKYTKDGSFVANDVLVWNGAKFTLKADEYIIVKYLPEGTRYTITEVGPVDVLKDKEGKTLYDEQGNPIWTPKDENPYVSEIFDGTDKIKGPQITGTVSMKEMVTVHYNNIHTYQLPETGGSGTTPYTVAGTTIVLLSGASLMYKKKFRERRG